MKKLSFLSEAQQRRYRKAGRRGNTKLQKNSRLPKKSSKKKPLTKEERKDNQKISSERVLNENVIGRLKRFKIISDRYRNRRKRFGLRFNLISGIHNYEINFRGGEPERRKGNYRLLTTLSHPSMRRPCPKLITHPNLRFVNRK